MGANDNERIRKEAADAIASRPSGSSDSHIDEAIQRYLGGEMYHALGGQETPRKRPDRRSSAEDEKGGKP